jgi:hypothetical protein
MRNLMCGGCLRVEPRSQLRRLSKGLWVFFDHEFPGDFHMPNIELQNIIRISRSYPARPVSSDRFDRSQLTAIALFSGIGLLVSLIAVLSGVQGYWY